MNGATVKISPWLKDAAERVGRTFVQAFLAAEVAGAFDVPGVVDLSATRRAAVAGIAAALSAMTSIVGAKVGNPQSASLIPDPPPAEPSIDIAAALKPDHIVRPGEAPWPMVEPVEMHAMDQAARGIATVPLGGSQLEITSPSPTPDPADVALWSTAGPWTGKRHGTTTKPVAAALEAWAGAKHLT